MTTKEELAANATDQVIEHFGRMPPDAVCERITEAIAAAIDAAVSAEQERLVALVTEYGVQPSLIAGIRSRGPAPERPKQYGHNHDGWRMTGGACPPEDDCEACLPKPAPVDPVREAARLVVSYSRVYPESQAVRSLGPVMAKRIEALALALEKTEPPHG